MRVGLTYDLREDYLKEGFSAEEVLEFDQPATIEAIERELRGLGHETERIGNVKALVRALAAGGEGRWDLVFNIAEGVRGFGRESQVPALLDAYGIPYVFSDPLVCAVTLHKGVTKRIMRDCGVPTPDFHIVEAMADVDAVDLPYPLFAKPVAEGTSKGIDLLSKIRGRGELEAACGRLLERFGQPVLVETFLPGREFTVGVVGTGREARVVAVMEVVLLATADAEIYTHANKEECESRVTYRLAEGDVAREAGELALAAWRAVGCRDGGRVDIRGAADGSLSVMEINPLPGLHPEHSDLPIMCSLAGVSYRELIGWIVGSAVERMGKDSRSCGSTASGSSVTMC